MKIIIPSALKHRQFALLWLGHALSVVGSQMQVWAIFWLSRLGLARELNA